jgi:hypothetical protein
MEIVVVKYFIDDTMQGETRTVGYFSSVEIALEYVENNFKNIVLQYDSIIFDIEIIIIDSQEIIYLTKIKYDLEKFNNGTIITNEERKFKQILF